MSIRITTGKFMNSLRSYLFNLCLMTVTPLLAILFLPTLIMPRAYAVHVSRIWARLILAFLRRLCGITYEIRRRENIPDGPVLIASKHQAMWETVALLSLLKDPAVVLKKELLAIPFYGWFCRKLEMIGVDRAGHASALRNMTNDARHALDQGRPIVIFPEGTRQLPGATADYKPGVAALYRQLGVPCVPAALNSGLYWQRKKPKRPGKIILEFLPPIPAGLPRREFTKLLADSIEPASLALLEEGHDALNPSQATGRTTSSGSADALDSVHK